MNEVSQVMVNASWVLEVCSDADEAESMACLDGLQVGLAWQIIQWFRTCFVETWTHFAAAASTQTAVTWLASQFCVSCDVGYFL